MAKPTKKEQKVKAEAVKKETKVSVAEALVLRRCPLFLFRYPGCGSGQVFPAGGLERGCRACGRSRLLSVFKLQQRQYCE
jgi:hypothetical protein